MLLKVSVRCIGFKPDKHEALNNWGCALSDQAKTRSGEEADGLFGEAREKFAEALRVKPDKHGALYNWGTAYLDQARTRSGEEADRLLREAEQRLGEAEELSPGSSCYNLACVCALSGRPADAQRWLETALKHGDLPDDSHIETDTDLDSVRKEPWFEALLETRRKK